MKFFTFLKVLVIMVFVLSIEVKKSKTRTEKFSNQVTNYESEDNSKDHAESKSST